MPDQDHTGRPSGPPLAPEDVVAATFSSRFRGFDQAEVSAYLAQVAERLATLEERSEELERALREARLAGEERSAAADGPAAEDPKGRPPTAEPVIAEAAEAAARVVSDAREEAARILEAADAIMASRTEDAEAEFDRIRAKADAAAATVRLRARQEADEIIEAARERGREMVGEAQAARERMLADLAKRKRAAQAQLEQLNAGRDRLLDNLKLARRAIDELSVRFEGTEWRARSDAAAAAGGAGPRDPAGRSAPAVPRPVSSPTDAPGGGSRAVSPVVRGGRAGPADRQPERLSRTGAGGSEAERPATDRTLHSGFPATAPGEERRSSSLRILRRAPADAKLAVKGLNPVEAPARGEGVRIIAPSTPTVPVASEAQPPHPVDPVGRAERTEQALSSGRPPASADQTSEPATPSAAATDVPAAPAVPAAPEEDRPVTPKEEGSSAPAAPAAPAAPPVKPSDVEELFARLRADRERSGAGATDAGAATVDAPGPMPPPSAAPGSSSSDPRPRKSSTPSTSRSLEDQPRSDADESLLQLRDTVVEPLETQLARKLKRALQDEQNGVLDRLRTSRRVVQLDSLLPAPAEQQAGIATIARAFLEPAARAGAAAAPLGAASVGVGDLAEQLAAELTEPLRSRLRRLSEESPGDEADLSAFSERISGVYREWKAHKTEQLAAHFLGASYCRGFFLATPDGALLRWVVDDEGRCPDCDDNALAGPTPKGESFPTGQIHPPAHVGCRCLITPARI